MASLVGVSTLAREGGEWRRLTRGGTSRGCRCGGWPSRRACARTTGWTARGLAWLLSIQVTATYEGLGEVGANRAELAAETGNALAPHYDNVSNIILQSGGTVLTGVTLESHGRRADLS